MSEPWITGWFSIIAAILGGIVSKYGFPYVAYKFRKSTIYKGVAEDINVANVLEGFHEPIFSYKFNNALITVSQSKIVLEGEVESIPRKNPEQTYIGKIVGKGTVVDGRAYIEYEGQYSTTNERWKGVAIIYIPEIGPASGYWMSYHTNDNGSLYGIGRINLQRISKA